MYSVNYRRDTTGIEGDSILLAVHNLDMAMKTGTLDDTKKIDTGDEAVSQQVIEAVADAKGVDPLDLPPLYDSIDPDALDALFSHADSSSSITELSLQIAGCEVLVRGNGEVTITDTEGDLDTIHVESQSDSATSCDSIEDRCGINIGVKGRLDTNES